jgi:glycosyltransferase involved in cell wall biosynthesis
MAAVLALDLTRLALGPVRFTPRGIDRVELAYARHFFSHWPSECVAVLPTIWGVRYFERERALRGLAELEKLWQETIEPSQDPVYLRTKSFLDGQALGAVWPRKGLNPTVLYQTRGFIRLLSTTGFTFGQSVGRKLPKGAIYLNVGQLEVFRPILVWLNKRPDVCSVFMIHDLIPIEFPEHHLPIGIRLHRSIVKNTAEFAKALIVPSDAVRASVHQAMLQQGRVDLPIHVELLPVPSEFLGPATNDPGLSNKLYFVVCGVIDSYKNHMLLLQIWQELIARHGMQAPKLVIAGSPGVTSRHVTDFIRDCNAIRGHVILSSGLSTRALRQLIINARALLMPSLAEGFGLPIVEALAQGTPVLASDIPAHREAGRGGDVTYVAPGDSEQWLSSIEAFAKTPRLVDRVQARSYQPKTWNEYFLGIETFLSGTNRKT